jgi:hypothetical protein
MTNLVLYDVFLMNGMENCLKDVFMTNIVDLGRRLTTTFNTENENKGTQMGDK